MAEIYRTVYTVEVFSRGPFDKARDDDPFDHDPFDLQAISYEITEGDCIGMVEMTQTMVVPPEALEGELLRIGNDGTFFGQRCVNCGQVVENEEDPCYAHPEATADYPIFHTFVEKT